MKCFADSANLYMGWASIVTRDARTVYTRETLAGKERKEYVEYSIIK